MRDRKTVAPASRRATRHCVSRRHQRARSPEGGRGCPKGESQAERDHREALGRSRGGDSTKACVIADGAGRAIAFRIAPGQAHELPHAIPLLDQLPGVPEWVVGERGYTSHHFREHIWGMGARPAIPPQRHEAPVACPEWIYNNRNRVEVVLTQMTKAASFAVGTNRDHVADLDFRIGDDDPIDEQLHQLAPLGEVGAG